MYPQHVKYWDCIYCIFKTTAKIFGQGFPYTFKFYSEIWCVLVAIFRTASSAFSRKFTILFAILNYPYIPNFDEIGHNLIKFSCFEFATDYYTCRLDRTGKKMTCSLRLFWKFPVHHFIPNHQLPYAHAFTDQTTLKIFHHFGGHFSKRLSLPL